MKTLRTLGAALVAASLTLGGCAAGPGSYTNEYITTNNPAGGYKIVGFTSDGYIADQLVLSVKEKMPSAVPSEGKGDVFIVISARNTMLPVSKKAMKPVLTTVTLQVVRASDQEIIYSLVKQYEVLVKANARGKVSISTAGWVDEASDELALGVARALGMEG